MFTAGVFLPVQNFFSDRMAELKDSVIEEIESRLGRSVSYRSISPSILRSVEVRGLVINGAAGERAKLLEIERLRIIYHPFRLLFGRSDAAVAEIRVEDTVFNLDYRRDRDVIELIERMTSRSRTERRPVFEIGGRNVGITYRGPSGLYEARDVFFQSTVAAGEVSLALDSTVAVALSTGDRAMEEVRGRVSVQGTLYPDVREARLRLSVPWATTPLFRLRDQSFDLSYDDRGLEIHKLRNNDPVDITVTTGPAFDRVDVSLLAESFVPRDVVTLRGPVAPFNPWLLGDMSGNAALSWNRTEGTLDYDADLTGSTNNPELPEQVDVSLRVSGDETAASVDELTVQPDQGSLTFSGRMDLKELLPSGTIRMSGFRYGPSTAPLSGSLRVTGTGDGGLRAAAGVLSYGRVTVYDVDARVGAGTLETSYEAAFSFDAEGESELRLDGTLTGTRRGSASIMLSRVPALDLYDLVGQFTDVPFDLRPGLEPVVVSSRTNVEVGDGDVTVDATYVSIIDTDADSRYVTFGLSRTPARFEVRHLNVSGAGVRVSGGLVAETGSDRRIPFESTLAVDGREYGLSGVYRPGQSIELAVSDALDAQVYFNRSGTAIFAARAEEIPLPSRGAPRTLSFRAGGTFTDVEEWTARVEELSVINPVGADSALSFAAEAGPAGGSIERLAYRDGVSRLKGEGTVSYTGGAPPTLRLEAESAETGERYDLVLQYEDGDLGGTVDISGSPLRRVVGEPIRGSLSGTVELETLLAEPRVTLQFETEEATFNTDSIAADGTVRLTERAVVMNRVNMRYLTRAVSDARGTLDLETGEATVSASVENLESDGDSPVKALVRATFDPEAVPLSFATLGSVPFDAIVRLSGIEFPEGSEEPWELRIARTDEEVRVAGGPQNSVDARIGLDGEFRLVVAAPLPVQFRAEGLLAAGEIEANVTNVMFDVGALNTPVEGRTVSLTAGRFTGAVRVVGPVNDPDFFGTLEARGVESEIDFIANTLGPADTFVVFQEKIVEINRFRVPTGEGYGYLTGTVILNRWTPEEYRLRIEAPESPGVRVVYNFGGLFVDGSAQGDLKIQGTAGRVDISGDILVDETSLTLAEQVEQAEKADTRNTATVDLSFETIGPTEFIWPNQEFPVLRALAERGEELDLTYASDTGSFSLQGRMNIQAGEIYYFDRSFYVRDGRILFNEDEDDFDPRLAVRAEIREISTQGPVRIFLIVDEERLGSFTPRFESSPPLTDTELIALLGGNLLTQEGQDDVDFSQAVLLTSDLVTQFGVINRFERSVRDALGLDLFSVRTQLFQNLVLGSLGQPQSDYPLDNTSPSLGKYFENTAVFLGKYLGSELFMELLFGLRSRSPFEPVPPGAGPVEFEAELGLEWQTPLFLLQWRFFPRNPETLFVTDNQLEFSWEFSY